ncbi:MAG: hypothetical protein KGL40_06445, partial [Rhodocyclaceae bacterium]|nr:hypothetical protein [Rhodocyclaceae bacterium]
SFSSSRLFEEILKYFYFSFLRKAHQLCLPAQLTSRLPTSRVVERRRIMHAFLIPCKAFLKNYLNRLIPQGHRKKIAKTLALQAFNDLLLR